MRISRPGVTGDHTDMTDEVVLADRLKCVIIAARFNAEVVEKLVEGALTALEARGAARSQQTVVWVPGALELPLVARAVVHQKKKPDAVVCLGCVIKGGTDHYEHVCRATVDGIMRVALDSGAVITNGVLTVATEAQAWERAGGTVGNKGAEAAIAAIETVAAVRGLV